MRFKNCIELIEKQNEEILHLHNLLRRRKYTLKYFLNPKNTFNLFCDYWIARKIRKLKKNDCEEFFYANGDDLDNEKKVAVYSCIVNNYDKLSEPLLNDSLLDYYCISDSKNSTQSTWKNISIPLTVNCSKPGMINRYCKLNPWLFFENYDFSIYVDGNIEIASDIRCLCSIAKKSKTGIAMHSHYYRDCIYNEAIACKIAKRGNIEAIKKQMIRYRQEGFPEHFGMVEATVIIVDLKNDIAKKIMTEWWDELLKSGSERDQISIPYVLWKNGYKISDIGCLGNDVRKNPKFRAKIHLSETTRSK